MTDGDRSAAELLHVLGNFYRKSGESKRGLVLLLLAIHIEPENTSALHALIQAFISNGDASQAINAIEHLSNVQGDSPILLLLKSRALWAGGKHDEARSCFQDYLRMQGET